MYGIKTKEKSKTHKHFLAKLKSLLPEKTKPIIVTDAGFKMPWIELVKSLKWDYVGRVRRPRQFFDEASQSWRCISHLFPQASSAPKSFSLTLGKFKSYCCHLVLYKGKPKLNQDGSTKASKTSLTDARGAKEPWLLISSLPKNSSFAKKSVKVYQTQMQIEESFRDMKSTKFGLGFEHNHTKKLTRMKLLVLLTTLTAMVLILLGKELAYRFQSSSIRKRRVLSLTFSGQKSTIYKPQNHPQTMARRNSAIR